MISDIVKRNLNRLSTISRVQLQSKVSGCAEIYIYKYHSSSRTLQLPSPSIRNMRQSTSYENAVLALNSLQSNAAVIEKNRVERTTDPLKNVEALDSLNIIHVSGTKGKGSTCAFVESILRARGFKTGFFSSPHLVHVRERIRINGQPISELAFAQHFWNVFNQLEKTTTEHSPMPSYFKFLTVMAYEVFLAERVDVAIIEVGIGGAYDCTNVVRTPVVCGVSLLDFDHQQILGYTLPEIAWQKAGIFKPNCAAVTIKQPTESAMQVLSQRAHEVKCDLYVAPPLASYEWMSVSNELIKPLNEQLKFGIAGIHQWDNVTLAVQLARLWMDRMKIRTERASTQQYNPPLASYKVTNDKSEVINTIAILPSNNIDLVELSALQNCKWPGRSQKIELINQLGQPIVYYIDGAHTPKSIQCCASWFRNQSLSSSSDVYRVLIFHCTGYRSAETLLNDLESLCHFDLAIFCAPHAYPEMHPGSDQAQLNVSQTAVLNRCDDNRLVWLKLMAKRHMSDNADKALSSKAIITGSVKEALDVISQLEQPVHVLTTGSLHLVGALLAIIDPELKS